MLYGKLLTIMKLKTYNYTIAISYICPLKYKGDLYVHHKVDGTLHTMFGIQAVSCDKIQALKVAKILYPGMKSIKVESIVNEK